MRTRSKSLMAWVLALAMLLSLLPAALAASDETGTATGSLLVSETYESSSGYTSSTTYTYDANGNLLTKSIETSDGVTTYTFDIAGNVLTLVVEYSSGSGYTCTYTYDANNNLLTAVYEGPNSYTTYIYTYDDYGNQLTFTLEYGDGYTSSSTCTYTYDDAGHVLTKSEGSAVSTYTYDDAGNLLTEKHNSGDYTYSYAYTYDADGNMLTEEFSNEAGTTIYTYTYDEAGNLLTEEYSVDDYTSTCTYTYDDNGNLLTEDYKDSNGDAHFYTHTYTYDTIGNVLTDVYETDRSDTTYTCTYTYTYTYDGAFDDVSVETNSNSWYYTAVYWAYDLGITEGYSDGTTRTFKPNNNCTRAEFTTFLYQLANAYGLENAGDTESTRFTDVTETGWYYTYVMWAAENGLVSGYSDGTFRPNNQITRAEAVTMLYGFYKTFVNGGQEPTVSAGESGFSDLSEDSWYYTYMLWATQNGVVSGYDDGTCRPGTNCTRSVMVVLLYATASNLL